jgi:predicted acylesterase/phospholipase RssA
LWETAADVILQPDVRGFSYDGFDRAPELIRAGEVAARQALPAIRQWFAQPAGVALTQAPPVKAPSPA